jgi:hypothetical protein
MPDNLFAVNLANLNRMVGSLARNMFKPGDKVVVYQYDGKEFKGNVVLTEVHTSGNKVRVRSGDFILNVDEKQVAKE